MWGRRIRDAGRNLVKSCSASSLLVLPDFEEEVGRLACPPHAFDRTMCYAGFGSVSALLATVRVIYIDASYQVLELSTLVWSLCCVALFGLLKLMGLHQHFLTL